MVPTFSLLLYFAMVHTIFTQETSSESSRNASISLPLTVALVTTSPVDDDSGSRCGNEIVVHAFVYDSDGQLYKEKLPRGFEITWYCHMRVHPICTVRGRNQLTAVFNDLNCGQKFSPLFEVYNKKSNYVKHKSLEPIQIGQAAKNCTMTLKCLEECDNELIPGKTIKLNITGVNNPHALKEQIFGVAIYSGLNGDLLYLGSSFQQVSIKLSSIPVYFKYKMIISIKTSMVNESCSAVYKFEMKQAFSVGIMANPPAPLRYKGPRRVKCKSECVALTPYCIDGWLVDPRTCGLKWLCSDSACGSTEGYDPLLLKNLPCGINFTVKLEGDPFTRAAHSGKTIIYEWKRAATIVLQVGPQLFPHRRSLLPDQSNHWISSISGAGLDEDLRVNQSTEAMSVGGCDSIVEFDPKYYISYPNSSFTISSKV